MRGLVSVSVSKKEEEVCDTYQYVVFTDVAKYLDWIQNIIQDRVENENRQFAKDQNSNAQHNHNDYPSRTTQRPTTRRTPTNEYLLNKRNQNNNNNNNNHNRASTNSGDNRNSDSFTRSSNSDVRRNSDSVPYTNKKQNNRSSQAFNDGSIDVRRL